jgi:ABC-type uncharacterized transport system involved in gliding motility auxiliary subunit
VALMRAYARYTPLLVALGVLAALAAGAFRLVDGQVTARVQVSIAVALLLFAAYLALEAETIQKWAGGRQARYGANAVAMSVAFLAIIGILNYLSNDRYHVDWDLTENKENTLADQTLEVLADLPEPVAATAFISNQNASFRETTMQLLQSYRDKSNGRLSFEVVDPFVERTQAAEMGVVRDNTVIFTMGDRREEVQFGNEQEFTAALIRLAHPEDRIVYFVVGHGEHDLADTSDTGYSKIKSGLERQNYTVETLNLVVTDTVPSDAAALIVAGPQVALSAQEAQAIGNYLDSGGSAVLLLNPTLQMREDQRAADPLADWLAAAWGILLSNDLVIDPASSQAGDPFVPFAFGYGSSPITDKLYSQNLTSQYPLARSVLPPVPGDVNHASIQAAGLVLTSPQAWGETDFDSLQSGAQPDDGADPIGPLNLAVTAENTTTSARLVVFGDADFVTNAVAEAYANGDILYNSVNWATGNTDLISIPPKDASFRPPLDLSTRTIAILGIVSVLLLPFGMLVIGVIVVLNRRARFK